MSKVNKYNLVAENPQSTVVAEYTPDKKRATHYQREAELEARKKQYEYYREELLTCKAKNNEKQ